jgi:hypothetical protein
VSERERTGLVVIRLWVETSPAGDALRARITLVRDLVERASESVVAADPADIVAVVRRFVDDFLAAR